MKHVLSLQYEGENMTQLGSKKIIIDLLEMH